VRNVIKVLYVLLAVLCLIACAFWVWTGGIVLEHLTTEATAVSPDSRYVASIVLVQDFGFQGQGVLLMRNTWLVSIPGKIKHTFGYDPAPNVVTLDHGGIKGLRWKDSKTLVVALTWTADSPWDPVHQIDGVQVQYRRIGPRGKRLKRRTH